MRIKALKPWYKPKDAAKVMDVSVKQIQRWMASGELPYCQISPRRRVILTEDLERLVMSRRVDNAAAG